MDIRTPLVLAVLVATAPAWGQIRTPTPEELQSQIRGLQEQMKQMMEMYQKEIEALRGQVEELRSRTPEAAPVREEGPSSPPVAPSGSPAENALSTAISVIPDFTFSTGDDPRWKSLDAFSLREVELAFSASVDPYARATVSLAAHKHGHSHELEERFGHAYEQDGEEEEEHSHGYELEVEEGYALFPAIGGGFSLKVGKFYADFGRENALHTHCWLQADRPWALQAVLGCGGHGLNDVGLSLSRPMPLPWTSEVTLEVTGGRSAGTFDGERSDLAYLAAWSNCWDFVERANLELQLSFMAGKNASGRTTRLGNASATFRYRPPASRWTSLLWRTEYLEKRYGTCEQEHDHGGGAAVTRDAPRPVTLATRGLFSYVDWQFARGWFLGARADWVRFPHEGMTDRGGALLLTWFPGESQRWRLQVQRYSYAALGRRDAVVLEYGFSLGSHGAHPE